MQYLFAFSLYKKSITNNSDNEIKKLNIDEMYNKNCSSDSMNDLSIQKKIKTIFISDTLVLIINMRPSIKDSINLAIHN
ncbi:hypothetical protein H8356DRAFT_1320894 [Neocallimastix lanati (nom. inval.)]|nr:hypothetical protein H8356DRAFT_1320894 [Neocallimastix sp. JGI-2020a]